MRILRILALPLLLLVASGGDAQAAGLRPPHPLVVDRDESPPTFGESLRSMTGDDEAAMNEASDDDAVARDAAVVEPDVVRSAFDALAGELADALEAAGVYGAPERAFLSRAGDLPLPVNAPALVAGFGARPRPGGATASRHMGLAFSAQARPQVSAVAPGIVRMARYVDGLGVVVLLDHGDECHTIYAHLSELDVEEGDAIDEGEPIGRAGGESTWGTPELYFEIRVNGIPVDPEPWFRPNTLPALSPPVVARR